MKFKVGDRVKLGPQVAGIGGGTSGITGTIHFIREADYYDTQPYLVKTDEAHPRFHTGGGRTLKNHGVWVNDSEATLLKDDVFIVVRRTYAGQLLPSYKPFKHPTRESAETEAVRLAKRYLGNDFVVFQMVTEVKTPVIPEPVLNQLD